MELMPALRLDQVAGPPRVAFVGAGGKTTALFQSARSFASPVLITASAHLAGEQRFLADRHFCWNQHPPELGPGLTLLTGPFDPETDRTRGLSRADLDGILALADAHALPLLIEADGSRRLPLKAPADHEPPIPDFVDTVVVVAGLRGLGQPLSSENVFRPEIFTSLTGLQPEELITPQALTRFLLYPQGGLKNIPTGARRIVLLNQADTPELQAQAAAMHSALLPTFDAVVISSLNPTSVIYAVHEPVAGVILAAGEARRFGRPKQLLEWRGKPLIWHVARQALRAGLDPVVVVCGAQIAEIEQALVDLPVRCEHNPNWAQGQGISVRAGVAALPSQSGGALFLLADQPQISAALIRALVEVHAQTLDPIIGPLIDGQRGNPVLFDQQTFADLAALSGERGGRALFGRYPVHWVPWHDPVALLDVDTPEDYARLLELVP